MFWNEHACGIVDCLWNTYETRKARVFWSGKLEGSFLRMAVYCDGVGMGWVDLLGGGFGEG